MSILDFVALLVLATVVLLVLGWCAGTLLCLVFDVRPWDYGELHGDVARRHRGTGAVQFILHRKGRIVGDYTYRDNWWHDSHADHWKDFETYSDKNVDR